MISDLNIFVLKLSKIAAQKKVVFWLILPYKTWWKPRFPMDWRPLVEGSIANFGISLDVFEFLRFGWFFFPFFKKSGFWVFLVHPETTLPEGLETSGQRAYRLFWHISRRFWVFAFWMIFSVFSKKSGFGVFFVQQNMVETTLPDGLETSGRRADS